MNPTAPPQPHTPRKQHPQYDRTRRAITPTRLLYPGPIGEWIAQELDDWNEWGYIHGGHNLMCRRVDAIYQEHHRRNGATT